MKDGEGQGWPQCRNRKCFQLYEELGRFVRAGNLRALKPSDLKAIIVLFISFNFKEDCARPSQVWIAEMIGRHPGTVQRILKRLTAQGTVKRRRRGRLKECNEYELYLAPRRSVSGDDQPSAQALDASQRPGAGSYIAPGRSTNRPKPRTSEELNNRTDSVESARGHESVSVEGTMPNVRRQLLEQVEHESRLTHKKLKDPAGLRQQAETDAYVVGELFDQLTHAQWREVKDLWLWARRKAKKPVAALVDEMQRVIAGVPKAEWRTSKTKTTKNVIPISVTDEVVFDANKSEIVAKIINRITSEKPFASPTGRFVTDAAAKASITPAEVEYYARKLGHV